jgi:hypothetical protein
MGDVGCRDGATTFGADGGCADGVGAGGAKIAAHAATAIEDAGESEGKPCGGGIEKGVGGEGEGDDADGERGEMRPLSNGPRKRNTEPSTGVPTVCRVEHARARDSAPYSSQWPTRIGSDHDPVAIRYSEIPSNACRLQHPTEVFGLSPGRRSWPVGGRGHRPFVGERPGSLRSGNGAKPTAHDAGRIDLREIGIAVRLVSQDAEPSGGIVHCDAERDGRDEGAETHVERLTRAEGVCCHDGLDDAGIAVPA